MTRSCAPDSAMLHAPCFDLYRARWQDRSSPLHKERMRASPTLPRPFSTALFSWAKTRCWLFSSGGYVDPCGGGSLFDELGCFLWMGHVRHMARFHFDRLGLGALRHHALLVRIDRPVCGGHHVPSGLVLPRGVRNLM